ncbi:MAG TPA: hypothetical protein VM901_01940 [Bdellovibrionota bacterium]|jgi:hypothetical protein|nr:hypothetical protein [Bdellovibrionota bacterium]
MFFRPLFVLIVTSFLIPLAQASSVADIEARMQQAREAGKHVWLQLLDNSSVNAFDSNEFERRVLTPDFESAVAENFEVIKIYSSELDANSELFHWVTTQYKPRGRLAIVLIDEDNLPYVKESPAPLLASLSQDSPHQRDLDVFFAHRALELKAVRSPWVENSRLQRETNSQVRKLGFLKLALEKAQATGRPVLLNLAPANTVAASAQFASLLRDGLLKTHANIESVAVTDAPTAGPKAKSERRFRFNLPSLVAGPAHVPQPVVALNETSFMLYTPTSPGTRSLPEDQREFFRLIQRAPQGILAVIEPNGRVDAVVNPEQWINEKRPRMGGPIRIDDTVALGHWLSEQPRLALAARNKAQNYCGGILNFAAGFKP